MVLWPVRTLIAPMVTGGQTKTAAEQVIYPLSGWRRRRESNPSRGLCSPVPPDVNGLVDAAIQATRGARAAHSRRRSRGLPRCLRCGHHCPTNARSRNRSKAARQSAACAGCATGTVGDEIDRTAPRTQLRKAANRTGSGVGAGDADRPDDRLIRSVLEARILDEPLPNAGSVVDSSLSVTDILCAADAETPAKRGPLRTPASGRAAAAGRRSTAVIRCVTTAASFTTSAIAPHAASAGELRRSLWAHLVASDTVVRGADHGSC